MSSSPSNDENESKDSLVTTTTESVLRELDVASWSRRSIFDFYKDKPKPDWGITVRLDVTKLRLLCKRNGYKYFFASLFVLNKTANEYDPMRYRIRKRKVDDTVEHFVIIHDKVHVSNTILRKDNDSFGFCDFEYREPYSDFALKAQSAIDQFHETDGLDGHLRDNVMHGTVLPWIDYESFEHALTGIEELASIPKFVFGKLVQNDDKSKWTQAFTLHVHHGLMDGLHMGRFMEKLQSNLDNAEAVLADG